MFLNAVEDGPEVGRRIFRPPGLKEGARVHRSIFLETDRKSGPSKGELLAPAHRAHPEVLDAPTDLRHELNHPQAGPDDLDGVEAGVPEPQRLEARLGNHQSVGTDPAVDARVELVGAARVVS